MREARIYGAHTKDFRTFTAPRLYIERAGEGVDGGDIIDTQIIEVRGAKRRFYRASRDTQITLEAADSLHGAWERVGDLAHLGFTGRQVEGPILFQFNNEQKWALMVDQYAAARGYLPLLSTDLDAPRGFGVPPASAYSLGASRKRHGGILNITRSELDALRAKWPSQSPVRLSPLDGPSRFIRHANYRPRLDARVTPAEDALWRLVPGLTGDAGTVSLRSVNFPDRHLALTPSGLALDIVPPGAVTSATFVRMPGLADPAAVSFRLVGASEHYLLAQGATLSVGPAATETDRRRATFTVRD